MPIRIFLVDDHKIILDSLSMLLGMIENFEIVGTCYDSRLVIDEIKELKIDVLITDLSMPSLDGIQLSFKLKEAYPDLKILMLTVNDDTSLIVDAFQAGISGYVMKKAGRAEMEKAIRTVNDGDLYYSQEVMRVILAGKGVDLEVEQIKLLTKREIQIIKLMLQEKSSAEIADELFISPGTVETHRHNIYKKLEVRSVVGLVKFGIKHNLHIDEH
ncbi:response regulator [Portibacter lacus]|uniref:DNA-binding response regulator n=1 Tax=Portibacter lacus TaxID=1099794 RepID=A0AA37SMH2_9BACT|nr:response regulator transcription factor [Portibacter lacus]GLR16072.1 DNA-binding response regulator [Portibacter lacus]